MEQLRLAAGYRRALMVGDVFRTKGGPGRPCCFEYSHRADDAAVSTGQSQRWGKYEADSQIRAKEIYVTLIPEDPRLGKPPEWGIGIRVDSEFRPGADAFVNISRASAKFALLVERMAPEAIGRPPPRPPTRPSRSPPSRGRSPTRGNGAPQAGTQSGTVSYTHLTLPTICSV